MQGQTVRRLRRVHQYVGVFFAPLLIFFAFSGAFQTLGWHEDRGQGPPQGWIAWMASIHKDQVLPRPERRQPSAGSPREGSAAGATHPSPHPNQSLSALKVLVLMMALGLIASALLGVMIALINRKTRRTAVAVLACGALVPVLMLFA